ncbi:hypothetical protein DFH06DRAFT_733362, partial [Mycena polygramma]
MPRDMPSSCDPKAYTFFWSTNHVNGWASQWYKAPFTATVKWDGAEKEIGFLSNEHWMILRKALLFSDYDVAKEVLAITGTSKQDMAAVKALERKVKNFDEAKWVKYREGIARQGTEHKFRQNDELRKKLFATEETTIVEASPFGRIWGIGVDEAKALSRKDKWGLNLLGYALMDARRKLREEEALKMKSDSEEKTIAVRFIYQYCTYVKRTCIHVRPFSASVCPIVESASSLFAPESIPTLEENVPNLIADGLVESFVVSFELDKPNPTLAMMAQKTRP